MTKIESLKRNNIFNFHKAISKLYMLYAYILIVKRLILDSIDFVAPDVWNQANDRSNQMQAVLASEFPVDAASVERAHRPNQRDGGGE